MTEGASSADLHALAKAYSDWLYTKPPFVLPAQCTSPTLLPIFLKHIELGALCNDIASDANALSLPCCGPEIRRCCQSRGHCIRTGSGGILWRYPGWVHVRQVCGFTAAALHNIPDLKQLHPWCTAAAFLAHSCGSSNGTILVGVQKLPLHSLLVILCQDHASALLKRQTQVGPKAI